MRATSTGSASILAEPVVALPEAPTLGLGRLLRNSKVIEFPDSVGVLLGRREGVAMSQIHQEVMFSAPPGQVYRALLDPREFAKMTGATAEIDPEEGGRFVCFGGYITGRHVELIPSKRIVQAWRTKGWPEGVYSIVRFELQADGLKTKLIFDQDGAPEGEVSHLGPGWGKQYWEPLKKQLGG